MRLHHSISFCLMILSHTAVAESIPQQVYNLFSARCDSCHGEYSPGKGDFYTILDFPALRASGKYVIPGQPENSLIQKLVDDEDMPPSDPVFTQAEKDLVRTWIQQGALDASLKGSAD